MRFLACVFICVLSGCGGGIVLYPVSGIVTVDGSPVEGLMVAFAPEKEGISGAGRTDAMGKYTITCTQGRGLPAGNYNVSIKEAAVVVNTGSETDEIETSSNNAAYQRMALGDASQYKAAEKQQKSQKHLPAKYNSETTLKEIVATTTNSIDFNLSSK
jgi:hypothetical protein